LALIPIDKFTNTWGNHPQEQANKGEESNT